MNHPFWDAVTAISTAVSAIVVVVTVLYLRAELKAAEKDRFIAITSDLYTIWQSKDFMSDQLWLLHRLKISDWDSFVRDHRGDVGEAAFHRVGSFYERVGTLIRLKIVNSDEILSTVAPYAIAVWQKIQPLVYEARRRENSLLFDDFERLLPECFECYIPGQLGGPATTPFAAETPVIRSRPADGAVPASGPTGSAEPHGAHRASGSIHRTSPPVLNRRIQRHEPITLIDVRRPEQFEESPARLPGAMHIPLAELRERMAEIPKDRPVITYCA